MHNVTLLLGSNMGDRLHALMKAEEEINKSIGEIVKRSKIYETASWGNENQPSFLNKVIEAETNLPAEEVMKKILEIEEAMGRSRTAKWESRIIDIDILFFENQIINIVGRTFNGVKLPDLIIPHPQLHKRRFTLIPLVEINALKIHPVFKKTLQQLLEEVEDHLPVTEYEVNRSRA